LRLPERHEPFADREARVPVLERRPRELVLIGHLFELGRGEMAAIQTLARPNSRIVNPPGLAPAWDL